MSFEQKSFLGRVITPVLSVTAFAFLAAGCASKPPPPAPPPPPPPAVQPVAPPFALTGEQVDKLRHDAPDTWRRIETGQPLILGDVKAMVKAGMGPDAVIAQVRNSRTVFHLTASEIIDLKDSGVNNQVIDFLIATPNSIGGSTPVPEPETNYSAAQTPPPPPPAETEPPAPGPDYVWVGGDWVWNGGWVWVGGHWAYPPYPGAIWFHGGWRRGWGWGGYRHYGGHWR